jgi:hypothetical protein
MTTITGLELKKKLKTSTFFKFLREDLTHNNFKYKLGENIDFIQFNPSGECEKGGLYFTTLNHIFEFMDYGTQIGVIALYDDSQVHVEPNKYKTDKFILEEIISVNDFFEKFISPLEAVKQYGCALQLVRDQTDEICLEAVKQDGYALRFVKKQTDKIRLEAVKQDGWALRYVDGQTDEICLEAVKQHGWLLQFVINRTPEICLEAVKQHGSALQFVKNQTPEICLEAVKQDGLALQFVKNRTPEICLEAVNQTGYAIHFVKNQMNKLTLSYGVNLCSRPTSLDCSGNSITSFPTLQQTPQVFQDGYKLIRY